MYTGILRLIRETVRRKHPKKWRNRACFLLQDNAPEHRAVLVKDFLAKNSLSTLKSPPYYLDLSPNDFYLFPQLKSSLTRQRFCDATDVTKNATK